MSHDHAGLAQRTTVSRRALVAACVGNAVEWYDFAIYGALGVVITPVFFPVDTGASTLLAAFAVYATAFVVRPLGAVVFGTRADARGRKNVLVTVVLLMSLATAAIGILPGYAAIGLLAPLILVLLRVTQGLAAGGELGLAAVFIAESSGDTRRGAFAAWHTATLSLGLASGLGVGGLLTLLIPADDVRAGWWRLAFLVALPLGLVGIYLRRRVQESPLFLGSAPDPVVRARPVRTLWARHRRASLAGFAVVAAGSLGFNTFYVFLPNHLVATSDRTPSTALLTAMAGLLVAAVSALALGALSDQVGRRPVVLCSAAALGLGAVPILQAAKSGSLLALFLADVAAGVAIGGVLSVAALAELFPTSVRGTGLAISAGLATAIVGGTAPLIDQVLFQATGSALAPALYVTAVAGLAFWAMWGRPETAFDPLR